MTFPVFLLKLTVFALIGFVLLNLICGAVLVVEHRLGRPILNAPRAEITEVIQRSGQRHAWKKLLLGDSVARQLYDRGNEGLTGFAHLASNQSITMAGNYILAERFLESNPQTNTIILVTTPALFENDLDDKTTFDGFVKPFYVPENLHYLAPGTLEKLSYYGLRRLFLLPMAKKTRIFQSVDYSRRSDKHTKGALSETTIEYLHRINQLCREKNITFRVLPSVIDEEAGWDYPRLRKEVLANGFETQFSEYFDRLILLDANHFGSDHTHIKQEYLPKYRNDVLGLAARGGDHDARAPSEADRRGVCRAQVDGVGERELPPRTSGSLATAAMRLPIVRSPPASTNLTVRR